jgi:hypothetical protein
MGQPQAPRKPSANIREGPNFLVGCIPGSGHSARTAVGSPMSNEDAKLPMTRCGFVLMDVRHEESAQSGIQCLGDDGSSPICRRTNPFDRQHQLRACQSAIGGPLVVSRSVWRSHSELISAPTRTMVAESHIQVSSPMTAPIAP